MHVQNAPVVRTIDREIDNFIGFAYRISPTLMTRTALNFESAKYVSAEQHAEAMENRSSGLNGMKKRMLIVTIFAGHAASILPQEISRRIADLKQKTEVQTRARAAASGGGSVTSTGGGASGDNNRVRKMHAGHVSSGQNHVTRAKDESKNTRYFIVLYAGQENEAYAIKEDLLDATRLAAGSAGEGTGTARDNLPAVRAGTKFLEKNPDLQTVISAVASRAAEAKKLVDPEEAEVSPVGRGGYRGA